jgi:hypothetical protein
MDRRAVRELALAPFVLVASADLGRVRERRAGFLDAGARPPRPRASPDPVADPRADLDARGGEEDDPGAREDAAEA